MNATQSKVLAAASVLLALPALSACSDVSFGAQTDQVYTPADGENNREGTVDVLNALIVSGTPGSGRLIAGLNNADTAEDDELVNVQGVGEDAAITFRLAGGETSIPAGGLLQLADDDAAQVAVSGKEEALKPGEFVRLKLSFANGEEAELNVPVLEPGSTYDDVELPDASATPEG